MKIRKITSLTALVSFVVLITTSVILYIVPQGRVAYWADWHLWGMSKTQWENIHINTGILFLMAILLHIYYNWKPIVLYLKDKSKKLKILTPDFNIAFVITIIVFAGTYFEIPPFSSIIKISDAIKDSAAKKYGEPPYGHAELSSLKSFSTRMGLDLTECMKRLENASIRVESEKQTILEIAGQNKLSPKQVYANMKPAGTDAPGNIKKLPANPKPNLGRSTLSDICREYGFDVNFVIKKLAESNITATEGMTFKTIAEQNNKNTMAIYEILIDASLPAPQ